MIFDTHPSEGCVVHPTHSTALNHTLSILKYLYMFHNENYLLVINPFNQYPILSSCIIINYSNINILLDMSAVSGSLATVICNC